MIAEDDKIDGSLPTVVRPAREDELQFLAEKARKQNFSATDLRKSIVFVVEHGGIPSGFVAARLMFQVEPLVIFDDFRRKAPPMTIRRAVFRLAKAITGWIGDREKNQTGLYSFFAYVESKRFQKLVTEFGMLRVYKAGKWYGMDL